MWSDFAASDILNRLPYNLQGHNVILEEKFKLRTNKLFSEEDEFPRTLLERWQGPPNTHKVKQYEIVLSLKVNLFIQLYSVTFSFWLIFILIQNYIHTFNLITVVVFWTYLTKLHI